MNKYQVGQQVRLLCTDFTGMVEAVYPNYEDSEEYAYAVRMPLRAQAVGMLPIEIVSEHLVLPTRGHPLNEVNYIASRFAWGLLHLAEKAFSRK